jgi:hypothetical protein
MAINKNHLFEDLDGIKCAIVETNVSAERAAFLKNLLEYNGYTVISVLQAVPASPSAPPADTEANVTNTPPPPALYKIGVTDVAYNTINAIFGRLLHTPDGRVVTMAYWLQKEPESHDEIPYYDWKK